VRTTDPNDQPDFAALATRVYRLCLALSGDESSAGDIAQESLMRAWRDRRRRRPGVSWWTWAAGFALRVSRETRTKQRRSPGRVEPFIDAEAARAVNEDDRHRLRRVHDAIATLPARQREVVVLRFILRQSTEACAEVLDCPIGTVKSNLHKAVRNLRANVFEVELADDVRRV
jgi:RNA polymerase sigma-70 factor (ECF subfamily)